MRTVTHRSPVLAMAIVMLGAVALQAQEQTFARSYSITPRAGMVAQFESALKAHVEWRAENGDPWSWGISTVEVGENVGDYSIRSAGHSWADFDTYDAGFAPGALVHWNATVAPLVESVGSTISTGQPSLAILPPDGTTLAFVSVTTFHLRPGREAQFTQAIEQATTILRENNFGGYAIWTVPVLGGGAGPRMSLVALHTSWADMAEPDPSFEAIMVEALGQDGFIEWADELGQTFRGTENFVLRLRPDLGVNQN